MRGSLKIVFAILIVCILMLIARNSIFAQASNKGDLTQAERDQEPPRDMVHRLQREIEDMQAEIEQNPSSPEAGKLEKKIQWSKRKIKEILSSANGQAEGKTKKSEAHALGLERYMVIAQNNLFTPLGFGGESKPQEFAVTGILSSGDKKVALIQRIGGSASYYVAEGESFGNGVELARIGENSVTVIHEGNRTELRLGEGVPQSHREGGRENQRRMEPYREDDRERMEGARREEERRAREEEERRREQEKREHIEREIDELHRIRDEVKQRIMEMEERGDAPDDAYRKVEEIDHKIRDLESSLR